MFYSDNNFNFDLKVGMDYVKQDLNQTILVYKVDRTKTQIVNIYGETVDNKSISYNDPVEINVILLLEEAENKSYDKSQGLARYLLTGNLIFGVYEEELKKNKIDISYGDFIGLQVTTDQMEYFEVSNDGRINFDNKHSMFGFRSTFRKINCVPIDKSIFDGI